MDRNEEIEQTRNDTDRIDELLTIEERWDEMSRAIVGDKMIPFTVDQVQRLALDAARYRFLRDNVNRTGGVVIAHCGVAISQWVGEEADKMVDEAMREASL